MTGVDERQDWTLPIDPDAAFEAVSNSRRRQVLLSLAQSDEPMCASNLAREIAALENMIEPSAVTSDQRTRVYISLIQNHLEKLDELGVAEYDERGKQVMPTAATGPVASLIQEITRSCYNPEGTA